MSSETRYATHRGGFSLIEVMVVVVIIALLAGIVGINVKSHMDSSRVKKARADIAVITSQIKVFYANHGRYPTSSEGLQALVPKYIEKLSKDPWGNDYQYDFPGRDGAFDVTSFGSDGREGGEDTGSDLTNWNDEESDS